MVQGVILCCFHALKVNICHLEGALMEANMSRVGGLLLVRWFCLVLTQ